MRVSSHTNSMRGFTIVELLIVIVVIGILAAITIVSFNGIQARAQTTHALQSASQTAKLLSAYLTTNGSYPSFSADVCISGYRSDNLCRATASATPARDSAFEAALATTGTIPNFPSEVGGSGYNGLILTREVGRTMDGKLAEYTIKFFLAGQNKKCDLPNSVRWTGSAYVFDTYDSTWSSATQCKIVLPQPGGN